jgi:hypothetical protein
MLLFKLSSKLRNKEEKLINNCVVEVNHQNKQSDEKYKHLWISQRLKFLKMYN